MGSMLVWPGTPRLDQLSWDCSTDRHADELSAYAEGREGNYPAGL